MKQEDKDLLLKDLCARLPYSVMCSIYRTDDVGVGWRDEKLVGYFENPHSYEFNFGEDCISVDSVDRIKPYLRPMKSMTDKEFEECHTIEDRAHLLIDWFNTHHFDYHHLIEKGLALEAPKGMYANS